MQASASSLSARNLSASERFWKWTEIVRNGSFEEVKTAYQTYVVSGSVSINVGSDAPISLGRTVLHEASSIGRLPVIKMLIETGGAEVDSRDSTGATPLMLLALGGHHEACRYL